MTSLCGSCRFSIVIVCPIPIPVLVLFPIPVPFPVSGFLIFQTPIQSCSSSKIIKLLSGSLLHKRNHIYSVKANWMEFYTKVLYIVIKRKGFQVMEVGINILNWPPSSVIFPLIFSISLLICSLILPKEKKWYGLFLTAKLKSHKILTVIKKTLLNEAEHDLKSYTDLGRFYPPRFV